MKLFLSIIIFLKFSTANFSPKIVGGRDAEENEFPYVVSLRRAEMEIILGQTYHVCGASILNLDTVVTASHCLYDPFGNLLHNSGSYFIVAGSRRLWNYEESTKYFMAIEIFQNPKYDPNTLDNDIAIIKVSPDFNFNLPSIQPITIETNTKVTEGTICSVHGWGVLAYESPFLPDILQTVNLTISNFEKCNEAYNDTITENQLCAYESNRDSCSGC